MINLGDPSIQLDQVRRRIGAPLLKWDAPTDELDERQKIRIELTKGVELTLDKVEISGGLFEHKGEQVVIYIKDHTHKTSRPNRTVEDLVNDPNLCNRVHLLECETIENMRSQGRYDRYVVTNRRDNKYMIDVLGSNGRAKEIENVLRPCKNCLKALNYNGYNEAGRRSEKKSIFDTFDMEAFFESFSTFFFPRPSRWANQARASEYVRGWEALSRRMRNAANWTCQDCGVNLEDRRYRKFLHVHHVNGVKDDNAPSNLEVVCASCHKLKPGHKGMHVDQRTVRLIEELRG